MNYSLILFILKQCYKCCFYCTCWWIPSVLLNRVGYIFWLHPFSSFLSTLQVMNMFTDHHQEDLLEHNWYIILRCYHGLIILWPWVMLAVQEWCSVVVSCLSILYGLPMVPIQLHVSSLVAWWLVSCIYYQFVAWFYLRLQSLRKFHPSKLSLPILSLCIQ